MGLSSGEAEIVALITRGPSNQEIAERANVSANTVKSYIGSAYREIGVERRTQAMLWRCRTDSSRTPGARGVRPRGNIQTARRWRPYSMTWRLVFSGRHFPS